MVEHVETGAAASKTKNLWRRIISGAIMGAVAVGLMYAGPKAFAILVVLIAIMMSWEWGRMVRGHVTDPAFLAHAATIAAAAVLTVSLQPLTALYVVAAGALAVLVLTKPKNLALTSALGVLYVGLPTIALLWFRSDTEYGFEATLFILGVSWVSDTAAFVGGKSIGGYKLWPSISPNKTWAGFIAAMVGAALLGAAAGSFLAPAAILILAGKSFLLGAISQLGDLAESAFKRGCGVKDASDLIPGHGGFMDRMDGAVAVAAAAGLLALVLDPTAPAKALLLGY